MDYHAYFDAVKQGVVIEPIGVPGADFNMKVTNTMPKDQFFNQSSYENALNTISGLLVAEEAIRDTLFRINIAV